MGEKKTIKKYISNIISFANSRTRNIYRDRASEFFSYPVTDELRDINKQVWQPVVGIDKEIITIRFKKSKSDKTLGISLQGELFVSRDVIDQININPESFTNVNEELIEKNTVPTRHYVMDIMPNTPAGCLPPGYIQSKDEVLQANGIRIWGIPCRRAISCMRNLPNYIELVLARSTNPSNDDMSSYDRDYEVLPIAASEVNSICTIDDNGSESMITGRSFPQMLPSLANTSPISKIETIKWIQDNCHNYQRNRDMSQPEDELINNSGSCSDLDASRFDKITEPDEQPNYIQGIERFKFNENIKWSSVPYIIQIRKDKRGFGFSIAEFELMNMNITSIDDAPIRKRSDPRGSYVTMARKGRSLISDDITTRDDFKSFQTTPRRSFTRDDSKMFNTLPNRRLSRKNRANSLPNTKNLPRSSALLIDKIIKDGAAYLDGRLCIGDRLLFVNDKKLENASQSEAVNALRAAPNGMVIIGVRKLLHENIFTEIEDEEEDKNKNEQRIELIVADLVNQVIDNLDIQPQSVEGSIKDSDIIEHEYVSSDGEETEESRDSHMIENLVQDLLEEIFHEIHQTLDHDDNTDHSITQQVNTKHTEPLNLDDIMIYKTSSIANNMNEDGQTECDMMIDNSSVFESSSNSTEEEEILVDTKESSCLPNGFIETEDVVSCESHSSYIDSSSSSDDFLEDLDNFTNTCSETDQLIFPKRQHEEVLDYNTEEPFDSKIPELHQRCVTFEPIPDHYSRVDIIDKKDKPLGLKLDALANGGVDGCRVMQVLKGGAMEASSKIRPDDYITMINSYSLRFRDNVQVFQILRKVINDKNDVELKYITSSDLMKHRGDDKNRIRNINRINELKSFKNCLITKFNSETGWGIRFKNVENGVHAVEKVILKSPADRIQRICQDDVVLKVNNSDFQNERDESIIEYIKKYTSPSLDLLLQSKFQIVPEDKAVNTNGAITTFLKQSSMDKSYFSDTGRLEEPLPLSEFEPHDTLNILSANIESDANFPSKDHQYVKAVANIKCPLLIDTELEDNLNEEKSESDAPDLDTNSSLNNKDYAVIEVFIALPENSTESIGLELVGNKDPSMECAVVHAIKPNSLADKKDIMVNDEILEVNGQNVENTNHYSVQKKILECCQEKRPNALHLLLRRKLKTSQPSVVNSVQDNLESVKTNGSKERPQILDGKYSVTLQREKNTYGLHIVNSGPNEEPGVFIKNITPDSPASKCGLFQIFDEIIQVDDTKITDYDTALQCVKNKDKINLVLKRRNHKATPKVENEPKSEIITPQNATKVESNSKPVESNVETTEIKEGVPTEITLEKVDNSLGFSIVGGKETFLGCIMIHEIYEGSVAAKDGRLWSGDRILAIDNIDILNYDHSSASALIKSCSNRVKLKILRIPKFNTDDLDIVQVVLDRKQGRGLGLSIGSMPNEVSGAVIAEILNNTPACKSGRLLAGDVILKVNDTDVIRKTPEDVIALLKTVKGEVRLEVGRCKMGISPEFTCKARLFDISLMSTVHSTGELDFGQHFLEHLFGITFRQANKNDFLLVPNRLLVVELDDKSDAKNCCSVQKDDRLFAIDGEPVDWLNPDEVHRLLSLCDTLTFTFGRVTLNSVNKGYIMEQFLSADKSESRQTWIVDKSNQESICKDVPGFQLEEVPNEEDEDDLKTDPNNTIIESPGSPMERRETKMPDSVIRRVYIKNSYPSQYRPSIGLKLEATDDLYSLRVVSIHTNSPAEKSGLMTDDKIIACQGNLIIKFIDHTDHASLGDRFDHLWMGLPEGEDLELLVLLSDKHSRESRRDILDDTRKNEFSTIPRNQKVPEAFPVKSQTMNRNHSNLLKSDFFDNINGSEIKQSL